MAGAPLVTGGGGFVGRHLVALLRERGEDPAAPSSSELDLRDGAAVLDAVGDLRPGAVFHLGARASVPGSWEAPRATLVENLDMTLNVLEAIRREVPEAPVLIAGSGEVYGAPRQLPVDEGAELRPQNPYAVSKAACDLLGNQYAAAHGLQVVRTRAFNHAGPGQSDLYVLGTLTRQVAQAEVEGADEAVVRTGNLDSARDFTDVRDVVRAYVSAIELEPGAYNVAGGKSVPIRRLLELVEQNARVPVREELDPGRARPSDVPEIIGSAERLREATGWEPRIPLEDTVRDALDAWRDQLRRAS